MEKEREYLTKKDLEKIFNKKSGYYNFYSWFEDLICNVCGDIIPNNWEDLKGSEQDFVGENLVTFCSKCAKLPNKKNLVKIYEKNEVPEENEERVDYQKELYNLKKLGEEGRIKLYEDMAEDLRMVMARSDGTIVEETVSSKLKELLLEIRGKGE